MPDLVRMWYGKKPTVTFNPNIETVEHIEGFEDWPTVNPWFTVANPAPGYTYGWTENTNPAFVKTGTRSIKNVPISHRSEEHTSELQSRENLVCRLLLEK